MNYVQFLSCSGTLGNCCSDPGIVIIIDTIRRIVNLIQLIAPILLLIMATIEFTKSVVNPDRKGGLNKIRNMFIAAAVIFFVPMFVNVTFNLLPDSFSLTDCWQQAKTMAESARALNFQYISPYEDQERSSIIINPGDYEKGDPKAGGNMAGGSARGILEGAEKVHLMYETNKWFYYTSLGQLRWGDVKYSTNNPSRATCCATFVGSALYVGGVFSESELNKYNYNSASGISKLCQEHGWIKIPSYSQLAAGDIVVMSGPEGGSSIGHVQIYAGNGTWYNAGSTSSIQRDSPYRGDASSRFLWAWRLPA